MLTMQQLLMYMEQSWEYTAKIDEANQYEKDMGPGYSQFET